MVMGCSKVALGQIALLSTAQAFVLPAVGRSGLTTAHAVSTPLPKLLKDEPAQQVVLPEWAGEPEDVAKWGTFAQIAYDVFPGEDVAGEDAFGLSKYHADPEAMSQYGLTLEYEIPAGDGAEKKMEYDFREEFEVISMIYSKPRYDRDDVVWTGFVALGKARPPEGRDVVVSWRGTQTGGEWKSNSQIMLVPWEAPSPVPEDDDEQAFRMRVVQDIFDGRDGVKVHRGFQLLYNRACNPVDCPDEFVSPRQRVLGVVEGLRKEHKIRKVVVTGHSLGGAIATLCAYDLAKPLDGEEAPAGDAPVFAYTFASPKVGNEAFADEWNVVLDKHLRVANKKDVVTKGPNGWLQYLTTGGYVHTGTELPLDSDELVDMGIMKSASMSTAGESVGHLHNMEMYLHMVDRTRSMELLDKSDNLLTDEACAQLLEKPVAPAWKWSQSDTTWPKYLDYYAEAQAQEEA